MKFHGILRGWLYHSPDCNFETERKIRLLATHDCVSAAIRTINIQFSGCAAGSYIQDAIVIEPLKVMYISGERDRDMTRRLGIGSVKDNTPVSSLQTDEDAGAIVSAKSANMYLNRAMQVGLSLNKKQKSFVARELGVELAHIAKHSGCSEFIKEMIDSLYKEAENIAQSDRCNYRGFVAFHDAKSMAIAMKKLLRYMSIAVGETNKSRYAWNKSQDRKSLQELIQALNANAVTKLFELDEDGER